MKYPKMLQGGSKKREWVGMALGLVLGSAGSVGAQGYDDAYDPGDYGAYSDPSPAPAPASGSGRGILGGSPNFRYGYLEAEYNWMSFNDDLFDNRSAYGAEISLAGSGNAYFKAKGLFAPAADTDIIDESYFFGSVGPGIALPIGSSLDITFDGGLAYQKFDTDLIGLGDGLGFYLTPGVRLGIGNNFELSGALRYLNVGEENAFSVDLAAHLYLTDDLVFVGSASFSEEINMFGVGLRVNF